MQSTQTAMRSSQALVDAGRTIPFGTGACKKASRARIAQIKSHADDSCSQAPSLGAVLKNGLLSLTAAAAAIALPFASMPSEMMPQAQAGLLARDAVTNARALLRYALPVDEQKAKPIRQIQEELESISEELRIPGSKPLNPIAKNVRKASSILGNSKSKIESAFNPEKKEEGLRAISDLEANLRAFSKTLEMTEQKDTEKVKQEVPVLQQEALGYVGRVEEAMVQGFPFKVPDQYSSLPQLKGRATIEMNVSLKEVRNKGKFTGNLTIVVDGYNAPVTAGNFVDLVDKKFYDGMEIQRADGFIVQTGDPGDDKQGYVDPATKEVRRIPFEIMVTGDKEPVYEENLEDLGRFKEQPVLPFNAYGSMALARSEFETNSGSSQIFWLLKESELTPTGSNLLDGRYAVFGYIVNGQNYLADMQVGDKINYMKVVDGLQFLERPTQQTAAKPADSAAPTET